MRILMLSLAALLAPAGCGGGDGENGDVGGQEDDAPFVSSGAIHGEVYEAVQPLDVSGLDCNCGFRLRQVGFCANRRRLPARTDRWRLGPERSHERHFRVLGLDGTGYRSGHLQITPAPASTRC